MARGGQAVAPPPIAPPFAELPRPPTPSTVRAAPLSSERVGRQKEKAPQRSESEGRAVARMPPPFRASPPPPPSQLLLAAAALAAAASLAFAPTPAAPPRCADAETRDAVVDHTVTAAPNATTYTFLLLPKGNVASLGLRLADGVADGGTKILSASPAGTRALVDGAPTYTWAVRGAPAESFSITLATRGASPTEPAPLASLCAQTPPKAAAPLPRSTSWQRRRARCKAASS